MAAAFPSFESGTVEISDVVRCILCKGDDVTSPLIQLNCFHVCHRNCLKKSLRNLRPGSKFNCPECKNVDQVPGNGLEGFDDEILRYKMKEIAAIFSNISPMCNFCQQVQEEAVSTHYCISCRMYLCPSDTKRHKLVPNHKIITNDEIHTEEYLPLALTSKPPLCSIHSTHDSTKLLEFYCQDCKVPLCQVCNGTDHKPHKSISMQDAAQKFKQELGLKVADIQPLKNECKQVLDKLQELLKEIEENGKQQIEECKKWGEDVKQTVDKIVNKRVQDITNATQTQKNKIENAVDERNGLYEHVQSANNYMEVFLKFGSKSDFLQKYEKFLENLNKCLQENTMVQMTIDKSEVNLKNVKEIEKDLEEMMKVETKKETFQIPEPQLRGCELEAEWGTGGGTRTGVSVDGEEVIAVKEKMIEVYGMKGEKKRKIKCQGLENAWDVELMDKQLVVSDMNKRVILGIDMNGDIVNRMTLPEQEQGKSGRALGLAVDSNKGDLYISSYSTNTVYRCPKGKTQAKPFITTGLGGPAYLCITSTSEVIITNANSHKVCKYNTHGELMWEYGTGRPGSGEGELNMPRGVCVDLFDHVFVCDSGNDRIIHLSQDGTFLSYINTGKQIKEPQAITCYNNKIIVSSYSPYKIRVIKCLYK